MLYNKLVHWLILMNVPYFIFVSPILDYISFMFLYYAIKNFYVSVNQASSDIGYFLILLMNITFYY